VTRRRTAPVLALLLALALAGCQHNVPTNVPQIPLTLSQVSLGLAQALQSANRAMIAARDQGQMSAQDCRTGQNIILDLNAANRKIGVVLLSDDPWAVQKAQIIKIVEDAGLVGVSLKLPPLPRAILSSAISSFNSILAEAGGPLL
jgi:hypothetical protein